MSFCRTELWNSNQTWNTETPQFTECFQSTVLVYTPAAVLLLSSSLDIFNCARSKVRTIPWSPLLISKVSITSVILVLSCLELSSVVISSFSSVAEILDPSIKILCFILSLGNIIINKHFGQVYSAAQLFFWSSLSICQLMVLVSLSMQEYPGDSSLINFILQVFYFLLAVVMSILNWFADSQPLYADLLEQVDDNPCPKKFASLPSRILFAWFDQLILKGWRNPLTQKDLWSLNSEDSLQEIVPPLEDKLFRRDEKASVLSTLFKTYWTKFLILTFFYLAKTLLQLANPQIINLMISFVAENEEQWKGYLYMVLFGCVFLG